MILSYAFKRVIRSWKLFTALLLGIALASTFFSGINVGADTMAKRALDQQLSQVYIDVVVQPYGYYEPGMRKERGISSENITTITNLISTVNGVQGTEIISKLTAWTIIEGENKTTTFELAGICANSRVHDGLTVIEGSKALGVNETLVLEDSPDASKLRIGDVLKLNFSASTYANYTNKSFTLTMNLTVVGFVKLTDQAASIIRPTYKYALSTSQLILFPPPIFMESNLLILSWENTFTKMLDETYKLDVVWSPISTEIPTYLDRDSLVNPWDVSGSITRVQSVEDQIRNMVTIYGSSITNNLRSALSYYNYIASSMRLSSLTAAIPVFFVAWYLVMAMSDVSLSLRRREIGLLLTKGLSKGQLLRMFLSEATLIGLLGGGVGIILSLFLIPFFVEASGGLLSGLPSIGLDTVIITIIFSVTMTLLAVFQPARKASNLNAVDALREYVYSEPTKPYRKKLSWAAFILGAYKICILLLGISFSPFTIRFGGNIFINIIMGILIFLDYYVLNYIGPVLFFWGFTKIFIVGSIKFQELASRAVKGILGDLSVASMRNVQRNPLRIASIAFLVALIIGYSVSTVGTLASEQDYTVRRIYSDVGADLSVSLISGINVTETIHNISQLQVVSSVALEYTFYERTWGMMIKAVNPGNWVNTAYYEGEWFTGSNVEDAFQSMASDNATIILERRIAKNLNLKVGDTIGLTFEGQQGSARYNLKVVGFFGPEPSQVPPIYYTEVYRVEVGGEVSTKDAIIGQPSYYGQSYWSYVPEGFLNQLGGSASPSVRVLVKLNMMDNGKDVSQKIGEFDPTVGWVSSVAERLEALQEDYSLISRVNIQRLGVVFSILAASVGTGLVTLVSLRERRREISLMSVRGLSYKQLITILLSENLAVIVFSVLLGTFVGLTILRGNIASANSIIYTIVTWRIVFPLESLLMLSTCFSLVFITTILPAVVLTKNYLSKLERIVRQA